MSRTRMRRNVQSSSGEGTATLERPIIVGEVFVTKRRRAWAAASREQSIPVRERRPPPRVRAAGRRERTLGQAAVVSPRSAGGEHSKVGAVSNIVVYRAQAPPMPVSKDPVYDVGPRVARCQR